MANLQTRIKQARNRQGLSQSSLAEQTGVSQPTVANWENGSHMPRHAMIDLIGEALRVEPGWLISGKSGQSAKQARLYLGQPISHIPVHSWPHPQNNLPDQTSDDIFDSPLGFVAFSGGQPHYQAFQRPEESLGQSPRQSSSASDIFICDNQDAEITPGGLYLVESGDEVKPALGQDLSGAVPMTRVVCRLTYYN